MYFEQHSVAKPLEASCKDYHVVKEGRLAISVAKRLANVIISADYDLV